jgi:hypothetical protein
VIWKKLWVKDIFDTCDLKALVFGTSVSIPTADSTWTLGKYGLDTSFYFSIPYLMVCHVSTPKG